MSANSAEAPFKVLYDKDCEICCRSAKTIRDLDKEHLTETIPLSEAILAELKMTATVEDCLRQMHVVSATGKVFVGYFAMLELASLFPATQSFAWLAKKLIPAKLGCTVYKLVADNRYGIGKCTSGACKMR